MSSNFDFARAESMWQLKLLSGNELVEMAMGSLGSATDSQALLELAICSPEDISRVERLFGSLLRENGYGNMSENDALKYYSRWIAALTDIAQTQKRWFTLAQNRSVEHVSIKCDGACDVRDDERYRHDEVGGLGDGRLGRVHSITFSRSASTDVAFNCIRGFIAISRGETYLEGDAER